VEYRVLGKLEVLRDGAAVDLGTFRQRALLALLLTAPNTVLSTDQLIDRLWGEDPPGGDRQNSLWVYVSGLRKALEPDREKRTEGTILLTRPPGYLVHVDPDEVDAVRFERLVAEGQALAITDPAAASLVLGEALALWRGRAYEDFTYESFAQSEINRLEELRLEAVDARIGADLDRGMSRELVSELETLVRQHPLREELTGKLMISLYRCGRQADALRAFQMMRARLGSELGIEPSAGIRRIEEQIVTGDESLGLPGRVPGGSGAAVSGLPVRGYELRDKIGEGAFGVAYRAYQPAVGREVAIKVIRPELANDPGFIRRFEAEAQLVARLEHPHIVPLYDYWREPGAAYLVMRLMKGGSLADVLDGSALDPQQASGVIVQLGSALQAAHRSGVVHRDIKPENILVDDDGNAYLSDFGIAVGADGGPSGDPFAPSTVSPPYAPPEQLRHEAGTPASDIYSLAVVMAQALTGLRGDVDQIEGALTGPVRRTIDRATAADVGERQADARTFVAELTQALEAELDPSATPARDVGLDVDVDNPYKGLRSFTTADSGDFHGRERVVDRLVARLGAPGTRGRFIAVVGPSGSGKSSVVSAGLLPSLRQGAVAGSESWFTVEMTPAPHPFEALEEALRSVAVDPPASLLEELVASRRGLHNALTHVLPTDGSQLLVVIDQFEELFTQVEPDAAGRFLDALVHAITQEHSRVRVLVTLRADFYDRPLRHRGLSELLHDGTQIITPMTPEELERAVVAPAERLGITFEPALVAELVRDVVDRAGALPLLQYTLTELFDARAGTRVTSATYRDMGGVSGALVKRADGLLLELGDEARDVTRQLFLRLVTVGDGAGDTRRRVLRTELEQLAVDRRIVDGVLDTFGRHRLLSFDRDPVTRGPTVEISHEALLTEWTRLRDWIDGARHDVRNQRRLAHSMDEWVAAERADDYLLRGGRLEQLHGWAAGASLPLSAPEEAFLEASIAERDRVVADEREREQRAVDAERRERQRARQLAAAALVAILVGALAVFGVVQWRAAEEAQGEIEDLRVVNSLASASSVVRADNPTRAVLLAAQAVRESTRLGFAPDEAVDAVHWALQELGAQYDVAPETPVAVRAGPNGPSGVYALSPSELVDVTESVVSRKLSTEECVAVYRGPCPDLPAVPADMPLSGGSDGYGASEPGPTALAGAKITLASMFLINEHGFEQELEAFTEATGIEIERVHYDGNDIARILSGNVPRPDVFVLPGPLPEWARTRALDLGQWLDHDTLRADFGDYLLNSATVLSGDHRLRENTTAVAVPVDLDLESMVYYPKAAFEAVGYDLPSTWEELMALSQRMVADGRTPWCMAFAHAGEARVDGWPGAHLIQNMVLRQGGVDAYDAWARGEIGFSSPQVLGVGRLADDIVFEPGFVAPEPAQISTVDWLFPLEALVPRDFSAGTREPGCWLSVQRNFMYRLYASSLSGGEDVDYFLLPPTDPSAATASIGEVTMAAGLTDRPEVRLLLEHMADPAFGSLWAPHVGTGEGAPPANGYLTPNRRFDLLQFGPPDDPAVGVKLRMLSDVRAALDAGTLRGYTHDVMPEPIGGLSGTRPNAFHSSMLDWVDREETIGELFAAIDVEWEAVLARGG